MLYAGAISGWSRLDAAEEIEFVLWLPLALASERGARSLDRAIRGALTLEEIQSGGGEVALGRVPMNAKLLISPELPLIARLRRDPPYPP